MNTSNGKKRPIVIGESNFLTGRLLVASLQTAGHPAVVGRDGDDVLKLLDMYRPEILILNMNLSRPSGLELLRVLHQRNATVKILATTAPGQAEMRAAAASLGVAAFFEIPFLPDEIRETVERLNGGSHDS